MRPWPTGDASDHVRRKPACNEARAKFRRVLVLASCDLWFQVCGGKRQVRTTQDSDASMDGLHETIKRHCDTSMRDKEEGRFSAHVAVLKNLQKGITEGTWGMELSAGEIMGTVMKGCVGMVALELGPISKPDQEMDIGEGSVVRGDIHSEWRDCDVPQPSGNPSSLPSRGASP